MGKSSIFFPIAMGDGHHGHPLVEIHPCYVRFRIPSDCGMTINHPIIYPIISYIYMFGGLEHLDYVPFHIWDN